MEEFKDRVSRVLAGTYPLGEIVPVCFTPKLIEDVGFRPLVMAMTQKHIKNALRRESESESGANTHELSREYLNSLPERIAAPAMIFHSLTRPEDSIVLVSDSVDKQNRPIVIALLNEGTGMIGGRDIFCNVVTSTYGRQGFEAFFNRCIDEGKLLFWDKKKSHDLLDTVGLQLPKALVNQNSDIIIRRFGRNVNAPTANSAKKFKAFCADHRDELAATKLPVKSKGSGHGK